MSKNKDLERLIKKYEKKYSVQKASESKKDPIQSTKLYPLDYVLSGGFRLCKGGHRVEFFGKESSLKTTMALLTIKSYQNSDKLCAFVDAENSYDKSWAETLGIDNEQLLKFNPNSLEETGDLLEKLVADVDLIVVDSIVALMPEEEIDRDTNEPTMALQARVNALITRKLYRALKDRRTTMVFINQIREKVGVMFGNPETVGGGKSLKHFYNSRIRFKLGKPIDKGTGNKKERIGYEVELKCVKNKKGRPYRKAVCDFYFDGIIDNKKSLFYSAIKYSIIKFSGKTYEFGNKKAVGKASFIEKLDEKDWKEIQKQLTKEIL